MSDERVELERVSPVDEAPLMRPGYPRIGGYPDATPYGYGYGYPDADERTYLRRMWRAIKKRKLVIIVIAVIVTAVVTVEVYRTKSTYQASTTVEIGKDNRMVVRTGDLVLQADDGDDMFYVQTAMKTRIRQLQSRPLLEDVVVNLKLDQNPRFMDVTKRRSIPEAIKSILGRFAPQEPWTPPAVAETPTANSITEHSREESARLAPYVDVLASNLSAEPLADTRMLVISVTHTDPILAADIVDNIAQVFIKRSFETKTEKYTNASEWLDRSTRELKAKVEQAEKELADYSSSHNIYSADAKENLAVEKLTRLHAEVTRAQTERLLKQSLFEEVKAGRVAQLPDAFSDPRTAELKKRLGELSVTLTQLELTFGPRHPKIVATKEEIASIQKQIDESKGSLQEKLKADYERATRDEASLVAALEIAKNEAAQQNQAAIQFNIKKKDVETANELYTQFLQRTNQAKIQEHEQHNTLKMIDPPQVPMSPVAPNRPRTILIGFLMSLVAGIGLVFFLEYLDNTVKTVEDVSRYTQLPALSVIPAIRGRKQRALKAGNGSKHSGQLALRDGKGKAAGSGIGLNTDQLLALDSRSSVAEAYRVLRTSVLLSSTENPPKTILVTSGQPGEGKTTTAVNTAISLAQLGASVLIIDCDLRKPSVHKALGIDPGQGLSTYLSRRMEIDEVIQELPIPNLSVLTSGRIPPNPAEMISSARMKEMLRILSERFDHIVIDSPPLLKVTDPVILSTMVDGVILVVHGGKSSRDVVRRTRQELSIAGARIFGVVLNNVSVHDEGYDSYYYEAYGDYEQGAGASGG
ncbi:MAG TPA: polysaccharide biosynthesis tyrosine autokinase [Blastocatellia bacterium]|nr:polysaccharide biosynthesis tyrosine autokinase [Blastocatellia bacterium]